MIEYRSLQDLAECREAVAVEREVWGFADAEVIPARLFLLSRNIGGQMIGAFDGDRLVGYCFSLPAVKKTTGESYLHSHMLAVLPGYRNRGVGHRLKLAQRDDALDRGIRLVEWTFDPLEIKNAYLNIERLGAIVRRYILNVYGITTSSLHSGLPTHRCVAEWHLLHPGTLAVLNGEARRLEPVLGKIAIPNSIYEIRSNNTSQAARILEVTTSEFQKYFNSGFVVTGFERGRQYGAYRFTSWE